jgi:hypothetical protein
MTEGHVHDVAFVAERTEGQAPHSGWNFIATPLMQ